MKLFKCFFGHSFSNWFGENRKSVVSSNGLSKQFRECESCGLIDSRWI